MAEEHKKDTITLKLPKLPKNKWVILTGVFVIISIILLILLLTGSSAGGISKVKITPMINTFVNTQLIPEGGVQIISVKEQNGLYVATINAQGSTVPLYFTKDGNFINQGSPLTPIDSSVGTKNSNDNSDIPTTGDKVVNASVGTGAVLGKASAPITIIEFSDFQCPFCESFFTQTMPQIKANYIDTGKVKLIFRYFPLKDIHPMAQKSAEAAECTRSVGGDTAFWKMHDKIFQNQASLSLENLKAWAKSLNYNIDACLDSGAKASVVAKDLADGEAYGVSGTPSFFINGRMVEGAYPYQSFQQIIDEELAKK